MFCETEPSKAASFSEAGFGFDLGEGMRGFHPLEVGYLVETGKSSLSAGALGKFISNQTKKDKLFPFALAVYRLIRATGRQIRPFMAGMKYFRVYAPGVGREEERPSQLLCLLPGKTPSPKSLAQEIKVAHLARLDLIVACGAGEEIKFYKISAYNF